MGHYNSEMEGEANFRARVDPINRMIKINKELESVPLSAFMAGDIRALASVQGVSDNRGFGPRSDYMDLIENRIKEWKKKNKNSKKAHK